MKNTKYLLLLLLFAFSACTNEDDFSLPQPGGSADGVVTCRMRLSCDVTGYGGATRSGGHEWEDGDRLYIRFHGDGDMACGTALYSSLDGIWTLSYSGTITSGAGLCCEVYYFENATHKDNAPVELTAHSVIYECSDGTYSHAGEEIILSAHLVPKTGRVRFISGSECSFTLSGISYYTSFDLSSKEYALSSEQFELSTELRGDVCSTDYIYGLYSNERVHEIELTKDDCSYKRIFPLSMLLSGKSGYMTVPTEEAHNGWDFVQYSGTLNGYYWKNLGLPSGIKWATCNVGATKPEEYGGYYAWGETEEKNDYIFDNYKWFTGGPYVKMSKYCTNSDDGRVDNKTVLDPEDDVAHVKWGSGWRMPTPEEIDELHSECDWELTALNGIKGYKVTGPNGNSIFLPSAGYYDGTEFEHWDSDRYWSNSLDSYTSLSAYHLSLIPGLDYIRSSHRSNGYPVRPVCE